MIIDIIVLVILLISAGIAFMRGFIREVLTIAGVVGGLASAYFGAPHLQPHMRGWFGVEEGVVPERLFGVLPYDVLADVLSYGLIFIVVVTVLSFISHSLAEWARRTGLGAIDRSMGFLFGLIRGILLLGLLYLPVHLFVEAEAKENWFKDTKSHFYLEKVAGVMASYLPEDAEKQAEDTLAQGEKIMDAREKLQEIELLKKDGVSIDSENLLNAPSTDINSAVSGGYSEEFRDGMDQLIDETSQSLSE
jgi:membrane protein required for colicin V production